MNWPKRDEKGWGRREQFTAWLILSSPIIQIRLHRILEPDRPEFYHSHPRHFISIMLWGWYLEEKLNKSSRWRKFGEIAWRNRKTLHAAWHPHGKASWSLVFFIGRKYEWKKVSNDSIC